MKGPYKHEWKLECSVKQNEKYEKYREKLKNGSVQVGKMFPNRYEEEPFPGQGSIAQDNLILRRINRKLEKIVISYQNHYPCSMSCILDKVHPIHNAGDGRFREEGEDSHSPSLRLIALIKYKTLKSF
jgi:hypothetical protein